MSHSNDVYMSMVKAIDVKAVLQRAGSQNPKLRRSCLLLLLLLLIRKVSHTFIILTLGLLIPLHTPPRDGQAKALTVRKLMNFALSEKS